MDMEGSVALDLAPAHLRWCGTAGPM